MSNSNPNSAVDSNLAFEDDHIYVTRQGDVYLKKPARFEGRQLNTIDPENVEAELEQLRNSFSEVVGQAESFLSEWSEKRGISNNELESAFQALKEELLNSGAVGDYKSLLEKIDERQSALEKELDVEETEESAVGRDAQSGQKEFSEEGLDKEEGDEVQAGEETAGKADTGEEADTKPDSEKEQAIPEHPDSEEIKASETETEGETVSETGEDEDGKAGGEQDNETSEHPDSEEFKASETEAEEETVSETGEDEDGKAGDEQDNETSEHPDSKETKASETETEGETVSETGESEVGITGDEQDAEAYYRELVEKAEQLVDMTDWPYVSMEFSNIDTLWEEGPDPGDLDINEYREKIDNFRKAFEEKKDAHFEKQKQIRAENLEKKKGLLNDLQSIIDAENWTATGKVGKIRSRWDQIKPLPKGESEKLQQRFDELIDEFDSHKVERLVRKKQKEEENLTGKLVVLDKMDVLIGTLEEKNLDWALAEEKLEKLNKQWHNIGRVPADKNKETWDRFHTIQDQFHKLRYKNDDEYRKKIDKFLSKKKQLIKEAKALVEDEDLANAAREVNKLHRRWKKVGNLPQKDENELWDQFKAATDAFNEKKSNNIEELRRQEEKNLEAKLELIKKAEELKDSEEWDSTHNAYQQLMKKWKQAGPVPRKKSGKIWKQFKGAMDVFYDRRRSHFKEIREDRKENLEEKKKILDQLKELSGHDNPIEAVEKAKPLQEKFKDAGYVPIKHKNKMWKEYREVCDVIYDRFRAAKSAAKVVGKENVTEYSTDDIAEIQKKQKEAKKLRKEIDQLHRDVLQMKESLSYFKPSSKGSSLLDEVHKKLESAESKIVQKEETLAKLEKEIDLLKRDS